MIALSVKKIKKIGLKNSLDFEVNSPNHNFYANGLVSSNSHSTGYGTLTAISTYLKANHPQEFFISCLKHAKDTQDPMAEFQAIISELRRFDIQLLPPHLLKSDIDFKVEGNDIRFGLGQIKGVADKSIEKLLHFKHEYSNKFEIFKGANEAGISIAILGSLILVGALDSNLKEPRSKVLLEAQTWNLLKEKEQEKVFSLGPEFNYDLFAILKHLKVLLDEKGKPFIKESRYQTIKKHYDPYLKIYLYNKKHDDFSRYYFEDKMLGFAYSVKLIDIYKKHAADLVSIESISSMEDQERVRFVGQIVGEIKEGVSREKKNKYLRCSVKDETGTVTVMLFNDGIENHKEENDKKLEEKDIVVVRGKKKGDAVFAEVITIQDTKVFSKISQVSEKKVKKELTEV